MRKLRVLLSFSESLERRVACSVGNLGDIDNLPVLPLLVRPLAGPSLVIIQPLKRLVLEHRWRHCAVQVEVVRRDQRDDVAGQVVLPCSALSGTVEVRKG